MNPCPCGFYGDPLNPNGLFLLKLDSSYMPLWLRTWASDVTRLDCNLALDSTGNIWLSASTRFAGAGLDDVVLLEFSPAGELLLKKTWGTVDNETGLDIAVDSQDRVYLMGRAHYILGDQSYETCILLFDSAGTLLRQRGFPDMFDGVFCIPGDGSIMYLTLRATGNDGVLAELDGSWNVVWSKTYVCSDWNSFSDLLLLGNSFYLCGAYETTDPFDEPEMLLLKCDLAGSLEWARNWQLDDEYETLITMQPAPGGGVLLAGTATAAIRA